MEDVYSQITLFQTLLEQTVLFIPKLIVALIIFGLTLMLARISFRLVRKALEHRKVDNEVALLLARAAQISVLVLGIIWSLSAVDFNITGFVAGLGIAGFTVGFALKDIAENFVAGVLLLLQQPFDIGDAVEAGGYAGTVINIEIRTTTIRTWDGLLVLIPNANVYGNPITNYSKISQRRISLDVGVGYDTNLGRAGDLMLEVARQLPGIKSDPEPFVVFKEFGDSAINGTIYFWIDVSEAGYFDTLDATVKGIKLAFDRESIDIPYPIRTVYQKAG